RNVLQPISVPVHCESALLGSLPRSNAPTEAKPCVSSPWTMRGESCAGALDEPSAAAAPIASTLRRQEQRRPISLGAGPREESALDERIGFAGAFLQLAGSPLAARGGRAESSARRRPSPPCCQPARSPTSGANGSFGATGPAAYSI